LKRGSELAKHGRVVVYRPHKDDIGAAGSTRRSFGPVK
jgi:hypothetical protein